MEKCPKCNGVEISVEYQPEGKSEKFNRLLDGVKAFMKNDTYYHSDTVKKEHLIFTCKNCGYQKAEPTKDAKQ